MPPGALRPGCQRVHQYVYVDEHSCRSIPGDHLSISFPHEDRDMPSHHREHLGDCSGIDLTVRVIHAAGGTLHLLRGALAQRAISQDFQLDHLDSAIRLAILRHRLLLRVRVD